jgi:hypothetical protein
MRVSNGSALRVTFATYNLAPCESLGFDLGHPDYFGPFFNLL